MAVELATPAKGRLAVAATGEATTGVTWQGGRQIGQASAKFKHLL